ncbi:alginate export family protein [Bdellovibrio reynosensis]|uniref:Alginate export family protein n=1 Tax=Bdellovibrio reynosensis TaxID=2835041 RepID=A0ABY4C7W0_9BACT|nr:alginate export family protein [Bdellovibrio reynosensis]UOF01072.1 alginate export family protein [Bdellovibrio reynosensis]
MRFGLFLIFVLSSVIARADLTGAARYEYIRGSEEELAHRLLVKSKLNSNLGPFGIFIEGFGEVEGNEDQAFIRRSPTKGYLQEAYLEFKLESFYVRVGRQALRWSESWTLPSLDVWTGRRFNRLFFDPLADQLTHPTGATFTYAADTFSLELAGIGEVAETTYPIPLPQVENEKNTSFGARAKWTLGGFGFSAMSAQVLQKNTFGATANYAFETAVPKIELGRTVNSSILSPFVKYSDYQTVGCDIFLGNWILLPQISMFKADSSSEIFEEQTSYYLSAQWNPNRHDIQVQVFTNTTTEDSFGSISYGYNWTDYFTILGFVQNYSGQSGLYKIYEEITGGPVFGLRMELSGNLAF